jgi:hypothetical protein
MRFSRVSLVNIATRLGIPMSGTFKSKEKLIELITTKARNVTNNFVSFKVGTSNFHLSGNSMRTLKIGDRLVASFPKKQLIKFATGLRLAAGEALTAAQMIKAIYDEYRRRRPKTRSPTSTASRSRSGSRGSSSSSSMSNAEAFRIVLNQLGLGKNTLEKDIKRVYGEAWYKKWGPFLKPLGTQAEELYSKLVTNLNNEPTANSVQKKKNQIIQNWKEMYEKELRAKAWSNIKNTNVRNAVMKYASNRKSNGTFPTRSEIEQYRNTRMRVGGVAPKSPVRRARAEVEEL